VEKIFGAGEWNFRKHRKAKDRRGWRKLHMGVDGEGFVVAEALTQNTKDDAAVLPDLLGQIEGQVRRFTGDGAYDQKSVYEQIGVAGTKEGGGDRMCRVESDARVGEARVVRHHGVIRAVVGAARSVEVCATTPDPASVCSSIHSMGPNFRGCK
jgi:hypothetical protein